MLRVVNFIETRRATQRCSFCVPTMLNPLGSKFEQDEEWCAALYISTRKQQRQSIVQILVGSSGLEPPTSRLSGVRSNHLSYEPSFGGDERVRTDDPLLAKQVLSQLSYTPIEQELRAFSLTPIEFLCRTSKIKQRSNELSVIPDLDSQRLFVFAVSIERR